MNIIFMLLTKYATENATLRIFHLHVKYAIYLYLVFKKCEISEISII